MAAKRKQSDQGYHPDQNSRGNGVASSGNGQTLGVGTVAAQLPKEQGKRGLLRGRHDTYDPIYGEYIVEQMAVYGRSLYSVCMDPPELWPTGQKPSLESVYHWRVRHPEFADRLARARECLADNLVSRIMETTESMSDVSVSVDRERIKSWQWLAKVNNPRDYGDKQQTVVTGADGGPVKVAQSLDVESLPEEVQAQLRQAVAMARAKVIDHE